MGGAARAGGGPSKFAFVTNNSAGFWNIAVKGVQKAEQDFGIKVEVLRPLKGELAEQQRYLEDVMVMGFQGLAVSPVNPDSMTPLLIASPPRCRSSATTRTRPSPSAPPTSAPTTSRPAAPRAPPP